MVNAAVRALAAMECAYRLVPQKVVDMRRRYIDVSSGGPHSKRDLFTTM